MLKIRASDHSMWRDMFLRSLKGLREQYLQGHTFPLLIQPSFIKSVAHLRRTVGDSEDIALIQGNLRFEDSSSKMERRLLMMF